MKARDIGFEEALRLALENVGRMGAERVAVDQAVGRVLAEPVHARVDSPSIDASLKDGYAVVASDLESASQAHPVKLELIGRLAAGDAAVSSLSPGKAMRILSGAPLPPGADAVLAEEFTRREQNLVLSHANAEAGRNILLRGTDVTAGEPLAETGQTVTPELVGLFAAGGISEALVCQRPLVGLLATGNEIISPGSPMTPGKVYASNVALQKAWFRSLGVETRLEIAGDTLEAITAAIEKLYRACDVVITSGGAWKGDRDLVVKVLEGLGWRHVFHRVRMGPGKAVGMGILEGKPVFCLPGGPASNAAAFIMIVLPAVLKYSGAARCPYVALTGRLTDSISGQIDWTQFIQCEIVQTDPEILLSPKKLRNRMAAMLRTPAIVKLAEGISAIPAGTRVPFVCLNRDLFAYPIL